MEPLFTDHDACYRALASHDTRFDGRVFIGCKTTRIYCRPVCRVRTPRPENCDFFPSAAAAEHAGFRPCLKCRPELAPGLAAVDAPARTARQAARLLEENPPAGDLGDVAARLGITSRHLRRIFKQEYGVSPVRFLRTRRLLLAKSLLTDTDLSITTVAFASGFGSIRRFNDSFKEHYRMPPSRFRKGIGKTGNTDGDPREDAITLFLSYRPPFDWGALLSFVGSRTIDRIDYVADRSYRRTVRLTQGGKAYGGCIEVRDAPAKNALAVTVSGSLLPVLSAVLGKVRLLFDLDSEPDLIHEHLKAMTVKAARTVANRLVEALGEPVETASAPRPTEGPTHVFPSAAAIASLPLPVEDTLGPLGITGTRARAIRALAEALVNGEIDLSPAADASLMMERLLALPGFGSWTVQYLAMRVLAWPDAFPHMDHGVKLALKQALGLDEYPPPKQILELAEAWKPWRSYATMCLWRSLA